jgi:hypothetical protein
MPSSGMLHRVALVITYVSEERNASIIRVTRIGEVGTTVAVTNNRRTLRRSTISETAFLIFKKAEKLKGKIFSLLVYLIITQ